jgi:predicted ribosomally synthesized peptide with SipW-like signal peptide
MRTPRAKIIASIGALSVIVGAGSYGTFAAFTDTTTNAGNSFAAGDLELNAQGATSALFTITGLAPGDTGTAKCLKVTAAGSLTPDTVTLAATVGGTAGGADEDSNGSPDGNGLQDDLNVRVERGTSASGNAGITTSGVDFACNDFVPVTTIHDGLLNAFATSTEPAWPAGSSKYYRITPSLPTAPQAAEGDTATVTFTWNATT